MLDVPMPLTASSIAAATTVHDTRAEQAACAGGRDLCRNAVALPRGICITPDRTVRIQWVGTHEIQVVRSLGSKEEVYKQ
jgi:hypothetical protein